MTREALESLPLGPSGVPIRRTSSSPGERAWPEIDEENVDAVFTRVEHESGRVLRGMRRLSARMNEHGASLRARFGSVRRRRSVPPRETDLSSDEHEVHTPDSEAEERELSAGNLPDASPPDASPPETGTDSDMEAAYNRHLGLDESMEDVYADHDDTATRGTTTPRLSMPNDTDASDSEPDLSVLAMARGAGRAGQADMGSLEEQMMQREAEAMAYEDEVMSQEQYEAEDTSIEEQVEEEEEEEEEQEEAEMLVDPASIGLKEISNLGKFTVSSHKPGNGVMELRSDDLKQYWQYVLQEARESCANGSDRTARNHTSLRFISSSESASA